MVVLEQIVEQNRIDKIKTKIHIKNPEEDMQTKNDKYRVNPTIAEVKDNQINFPSLPADLGADHDYLCVGSYI